MRSLKTVGLFVVLCSAPTFVRADVLTVDGVLAHGADFTEIQDAIGEASTGDVILVAPGHYNGFTVLGPSLDLIAEGDVTVHGAVSIEGLAAHERVSLVGFNLVGAPLPVEPPPQYGELVPPALSILYCEGTVRVERTHVSATSWPSDVALCGDFFGTVWPAGGDGVLIDYSDDVVLQTCVFNGGFGISDGGDSSLYGECLDDGSDGGRGLVIDHSRVHLHNVIANGADGAQHGVGGSGGVGVVVRGGSEVLTSGVVATGGDGAWGTDAIAGYYIANGGDGLTAGMNTDVAELGGVYTGGEGGWPGVDRDIDGAYTVYPGSAHRFVTTGPAREGGDLTLSLSGAAGDLAWLFAGFDTTLVDKPGYGGAIYIAPPFALGPNLILSLQQGVNLLDVPIPELGPGVDAVALDLQVYVLEASGERVLSAPTRAVLLDSAY